jgi:hypothetical protein
MISACVEARAVANTISQMAMRGPIWPACEFNRGGTKAELRPLSRHAEQEARQEPRHHKDGPVAKPVEQGFDHVSALNATLRGP